ncbi:hypothetical protein NQ314_002500 [Rhamnusium bicolor]|uniref:Lipase domain-containing protein n=1 Tax=Rhamnusium bicolor TaxID=1586634 RepID=A0AAV8ZS15_9CUCU|nr:hypothetical protein NQ314_002500 [Rhamnusium bicolor]
MVSSKLLCNNTYIISEMEEAIDYYRSFPRVDFSLADAEKSDVTYKYFNNSLQETGKILTVENVRREIVNKTIPMVLFIHGWTTDDTSPWYGPLKEEYFKLGPHNIIYIDWSNAGNKSYEVSSANIKPVGKFIALFLFESGVSRKNIHLVGHSLGSHLASFIGKSMIQLTGKKLGRITALDPAGPKFETPLMGYESRLYCGDADFVDVIHTDIQLYGYTTPIGHVDFYPNEGKQQPGCPPRDENESISRKSTAQEAIFKQIEYQVTIQVKENPREVIFGQHIDKSARGTYYFKTNAQAPFLK